MTIPIVTTGDRSILDAFYDKSRRLTIITCAGGNRNAMTAGAMVSLRQRRLMEQPIAFAGISSGIATNAYFMGGGKAPGVKVFSDDMSDKRMFDIARRLRGQHPFDVDYVERVFRGIETGRGIDADQVLKHRAPLYAVLAHAHTGEAIIVEPHTAEQVWQLASYGAAVTGFARPLTYNGVPVTDGYFTQQQLPVPWLIEQLRPTDILVFAGMHYEERPRVSPLLERALYTSGLARAPKPIRNLIKTRHIRFMETAAKAVERTDTRVFIVWVSEKLSPVYIDQAKSHQLIKNGYQTMELLFRQRHL